MNKILMITVLLVINATNTFADEIEIGQKNKKFTKKNVVIKAGDTVKFANQDPFFHNIFSLSELKSFDLGSFPKGQSRSVTFEKPGTYDIECAIHPSMQMKIHVK